MTPEQIDAVRSVVGRLAGEPRFAERFYARLFAEAPQVESLFPDLAAQRAKLSDELAAMVEMLADLPSLDARARELGARHRGYGVRAADYRLARRCMSEAVEEVLADSLTDDEREAWLRATNLISELMLAP